MDSKKKKNLEDAFERVINVGLCTVPYEDLSNLAGPELMLFGTTKDEKVFSFSDLDAMIKSQYEQMGDMVPTLDRNRLFTRISNDGNNAFITEEATLTISSPEEVNTIFIRCSCVMEYIDSQWKITHWHSSTPVDTENDHWHQEEWKREKEKLQKLVDEQTADLQAKNRELEIEAALERVRSRTMAMQSSDEFVDVAAVLFDQIRILGGNLWGTGFGLCEEDADNDEFWFANENGVFPPVSIPNTVDPAHKKMYEGWENEMEFLAIEGSGQDLKNHYNYMMTLPEVRPFFQKILDEGLSFPEWQQWNAAYFSHGYLLFITLKPYPDPDVLKRFARVFDQTYTRFLDLKKAEEQARESEIQLALERVRARSMAMHKSDELADLSLELVKQVHSLGIDTWFCAFNIYDDHPEGSIEWGSNGQGTFSRYRTPREGVFLDYYEAGQRGETLFINEIGEDECPAHYLYLCSLPGVGDQLLKMKDEGNPFPTSQIDHVAFFKYGYIIFITFEPVPEAHEIFKRFAKVFQQTYTRFLDLQKAEAQAHEAKIEVALEKIRSRTMGMQSSDELPEVANLMFLDVQALGIPAWSCGYCILLDDGKSSTCIMSSEGTLQKPFLLPHSGEASFTEWDDFVQSDETFFTQELGGKAIESHYNFMKSLPQLTPIFREIEEAGLSLPTYQINHLCKISHGFLLFITYEQFPDAHDIFKRFTNVFEQTYTRFLDLKKAETQAREAQIEAALERVRSVSMAMHESDELVKVATTVYRQLIGLGFDSVVSGGFNFPDAENNVTQCWFAETAEESFLQDFKIPFGGDPVLDERHEYRQKGMPFLEQVLKREEVENHMEFVFPNEKSSDEELAARKAMPDPTIFSIQFLNEGYMILISVAPLSEEQKSILGRFSSVFNSAYTRFLDLKKAEEQAREAEIEAGLERIRSRSMAMQSSNELSDVVRVMYNEVEKLEISNWGSALMIFDDKNKNIQMWFSEHVNNKHIRPYEFDNLNHELVRKWWKFWKSEDEFLTVHLKDEDNEKWTNYLFEDTGMKNLPKDVKEAIRSDNEVHFIYSKMKQGLVSFINLQPFSEEIYPILKRITRTFEQAFTRFLDVQRAEKLALETARQSSLDRIRAEIGSMRSAKDLQQITPIIWDELKTLEIPFIRCGVFIIDEENGISHTYLSTAQGDPIAAMHLPMEDIPLVKNAVSSWKQKKIYTEHWDEEDFHEWTQNLINRGFIDSKKKYEAGSAPKTLDLHFLPFKHGMLYIGNTEPLSKEKLDLGQSMAKAFSVAYDRYEDFNKLEQAKKKIEEAFKELEAAKDQLVQQEKLASLGQLTAGIAHEIKNPLNFVNNFSDLSIELVEEIRHEIRDMRREMEDSPFEGGAGAKAEVGDDTNDNHDLILDILDDIEANLKTIHKHGSRADSIVKSMLQHSRGGDGKMEPTELNPIIKEYVNLAFHGMRAGKDPINVDIELDLDDNVGEIDLIAEDFSRVILNLCNNGFDAMREKLAVDSMQLTKSPLEGSGEAERSRGVSPSQNYRPKLSVRTKSSANAISIQIEDNGPGIPDEIKDKILQPFFTTKKGTEGTGLGLSITNDIIKAHGGVLEIHSKEEGTNMTVTLNQS